jgi:choline dehydrogenase-like flavoprotein
LSTILQGRIYVDFVCRERRLIVEVDGGQHSESKDRQPDATGKAQCDGEMPGPGSKSEQELVEFMHSAGMNLHHPVGTCHMGEDPTAVVDSRLRVHGSASSTPR